MKYILSLASILILSQVTYADETVCASKVFHYMTWSYSSGARPRPGMVVDETTIIYKNKILLNEKLTEGQGRYAVPAYKVELSDPPIKILEQNGNELDGSSVTRQLVKLIKVDSVNPSKQNEIATLTALCSQSWSRTRP